MWTAVSSIEKPSASSNEIGKSSSYFCLSLYSDRISLLISGPCFSLYLWTFLLTESSSSLIVACLMGFMSIWNFNKLMLTFKATLMASAGSSLIRLSLRLSICMLDSWQVRMAQRVFKTVWLTNSIPFLLRSTSWIGETMILSPESWAEVCMLSRIPSKM